MPHFLIVLGLKQGCTNPRHKVVCMTKFCPLVLTICEYSVGNLLHVTPLVLRILRLFLDFCKTYASLVAVKGDTFYMGFSRHVRSKCFNEFL